TFGGVYKMLPFDNRVVIVNLSGREVRDIIASQARKGHRRAGFSGMSVFVSCNNDVMDITLQLDDGRELADDAGVTLLANDFLALGGDDVLTPVIPDEGFEIDEGMPLIRDVLVDWFKGQSGQLSPDKFESTASPRWNLPDSVPDTCRL
ncbi:MAG: 5'-nucleotidase C-terminal domain-containing protein, partial [Woeseiaceae bacterium]